MLLVINKGIKIETIWFLSWITFLNNSCLAVKNSSNLPSQKTDNNHKERIVPETEKKNALMLYYHSYN